jgi:hypothetical protein
MSTWWYHCVQRDGDGPGRGYPAGVAPKRLSGQNAEHQ